MANFSIDQFTSQLSGGGARTNLFQLALTRTNLTDFQYMCKATQVPASTIGMIEVPYFGRNIKIAGDSREFTQLTTTVVNDEGMVLKRELETWMQDFNHASDNTAKTGYLGNRSSYTETLTLTSFKKDGAEDQTWEFKGCWPSNISAIDLNWDTIDTLQEIVVDWQYDYFTHAQAGITSSAS